MSIKKITVSIRDSITLLLDNTIAFIGDLPPEDQIMDDDTIGKKNWKE